jgi:hypothetical protein
MIERGVSHKDRKGGDTDDIGADCEFGRVREELHILISGGVGRLLWPPPKLKLKFQGII